MSYYGFIVKNKKIIKVIFSCLIIILIMRLHDITEDS